MRQPYDMIRDELRAMKAYHVPDASGLVKLDAMENPYSLPQALRDRIGALASDAAINRYPDASAARLKARLKGSLGVPEGMTVLLGNGSDEIIQMLMLAMARPQAVVVGVEPSFVMFRLIALFCGLRYVGVPLAPDFSLDTRRLLQAIEEHRPALVFLAYPNNPTGNLFDPQAVESVLRASPGAVVLDEAYQAFAGRTFLGRLPDFDNLLVMRTLSKSGLAGLRLGVLAGAPAWLDEIDKIRLPYNVGVLTQLVAETVLEHEDVLREQAEAIKTERSRLMRELVAMDGAEPFPSEANFILFRVASADAAFQKLKARGVLVKNLHGAHPALENCLRVTVGTRDENDLFLGALRPSIA